MKKKLLTLLLSIFMVIPIVGCGERDLDQDPKDSETKIVLKFAHYDEVEGVSSKNNVPYRYSDCASLTGSGFYKMGETATLSIDFTSACSFKGWGVADGSGSGEIISRSTDSATSWDYRIKESDIGHTVEIYAQMHLSEVNTPFTDNATKFHLSNISTTRFTFSTKYDVTMNGSDKYQFTIGAITYTEGVDGNNKPSFNGSDGSKNTILENGGIVINGNYYIIVYEVGIPVEVGLSSGGSHVTPTNIDKTYEYPKYKFAGSKISFANFANTLETKPGEKGVTLYDYINSDADQKTNLSYYYYEDELQFYKITWKYAAGLCSEVVPHIEFDPMTKVFENANVCIAANIDFTQGITQDFVKDAIKSTFYNRAYVATDSSHACVSEATTKANVSIDDKCMYIKNIGVLKSVEKNNKLSLEDVNLTYYALSTNSLGLPRIEAFESQFGNNYYTSMTYETAQFTGNKDLYKTGYDATRFDDYNVKIKDLYNALTTLLASPGNLDSSVTFGYSPNTDSIAIKSIKVGATTYYFNYVAPAEEGNDYKPVAIGENPVHVTSGIVAQQTSHYKFAMEIPASETDKVALTELKNIILSNPQNLFDTNNTTDRIVKLIQDIINSKSSLSVLKKYDFKASLSSNTVTVTYENGVIDLSAFANFKYGYDSNDKIYFIPFDDLSNPTSLGTSTDSKLNELYSKINILSSAENIINNEDYYIQIDRNSSLGYIEYRFYDIESRTSLEYKLRYYESATSPKFQVININSDRLPPDIELTLIKPGEEPLFTNGAFDIVEEENKKLSTSITYSNLVKDSLYRVEIDGVKYYIDMKRANVVTELISNEDDKDLTTNLATAFKYYFVIEKEGEDDYYGLYETEFNSNQYTVIKIDFNKPDDEYRGVELLTVSVDAIYIESRKQYYIVENDGSEYITIDGDRINLTENGGKYSLTINKVTVVNPQGAVIEYQPTDDIYKLYQMMNDPNTDIRYVSTAGAANRIMFVSNSILYELTPGAANEYTIKYNETTYTVTFVPNA